MAPVGLTDEVLVDALLAGWDVRAVGVTYPPVGFGSHHWLAIEEPDRHWFVTVDDLHERMHGPGDSLVDVERRLSGDAGPGPPAGR